MTCVGDILRGRWSQGSTSGCQLETLAAPQRERPNAKISIPNPDKIEHHKAHDHGDMHLTKALGPYYYQTSFRGMRGNPPPPLEDLSTLTSSLLESTALCGVVV